MREPMPTKIRPYPMRSGAEHDPADASGSWRRHIAKLALVMAGIEHRVRLVDQARFWPVINPPGLRQHDVAFLILAGNPIGVFGRQIAIRRIIHINQFEPVAVGDFPLVHIEQLAEVMSQPQMKTRPPCGFVALKNKSGEEAGWT